MEEKREAIAEHCAEHGCEGCPIFPLVKDGNENCYSPGVDRIKDPNIERNYTLIFGGCEPTTEPEKNCDNCHHILCAAFDYPCAECWDGNKWEPKDEKQNPYLERIFWEPKEEKQNPYWERITAIADKQRTKGMSKYGQGLEANPADILARINHLQEELIDGLMYCEWIKEWVQENLVKDEQG